MDHQMLLKKCLSQIEKSLGWVDSENWQHQHFELLSQQIFEKTRVSLSPLTLKRLWGKVSYHSSPSVTTLDTLAKYLGYQNWIEYQHQAENKQRNTWSRLFTRYERWPQAILFLLLAVLFLVLGIRAIPQFQSKDYDDFEFSVQPLVNKIPNTVHFNYNVKNTDADSVIIQQYWDPNMHHVVDKNKTVFSCIYYYPGYYKAKLVLDQTVVAQQDLYIKSGGWLGIINKNPVPHYLDLKTIARGNVLEITASDLNQAGFDLRNEVPYTTIDLVEEFEGIQGNNFQLQAAFKQTYPLGPAVCQKSALMILCSDGYFMIPFSIKGCVSELQMNIPEKVIRARDHDLQALGLEYPGFVQVDLEVLQGEFDLTINNDQHFSDSLTMDPGKIVGVKFAFHGSGVLKSFELKSDQHHYTMSDFMP